MVPLADNSVEPKRDDASGGFVPVEVEVAAQLCDSPVDEPQPDSPAMLAL